MDGHDEMTEERHTGRMEAEAFDLRLRASESREREDRLTRLVAERPDLSAAPMPLAVAVGDPGIVGRLQREVALLAEFHNAVVHSKGWRLLQVLRRPFGRAW